MRVWRSARALVKTVFSIAAAMEADGGLGTQMKRAAISIVSNIAEGAERGGETDFRRFLYMARGSCGELQAQMMLANDLGFINGERFSEVDDRIDHVGRMISRLISSLEAGRRYENR